MGSVGPNTALTAFTGPNTAPAAFTGDKPGKSSALGCSQSTGKDTRGLRKKGGENHEKKSKKGDFTTDLTISEY